MVERTFVMVKPDAIQRGIIGDIISRFERVGLKVVGARMIQVPEELANRHYPKDREEFIIGMGKKTLENYQEQGLDPKKELGSDDPKEIGILIQKWLVDFLTSSPVMSLVLEGPHAVEVVRKIVGFTLPSQAVPGTIRGDYSFDSSALANTGNRPVRNLVHASGNREEADFEISLWFEEDDLFDYDTIHSKNMVG